MNTAAFRTNKL